VIIKIAGFGDKPLDKQSDAHPRQGTFDVLAALVAHRRVFSSCTKYRPRDVPFYNEWNPNMAEPLLIIQWYLDI